MEQHFWELIQQNAEHIRTMNYEMGQIVSSIGWIRNFMIGCFSVLGGLIVGTWVTIFKNLQWTKKNGKHN